MFPTIVVRRSSQVDAADIQVRKNAKRMLHWSQWTKHRTNTDAQVGKRQRWDMCFGGRFLGILTYRSLDDAAGLMEIPQAGVAPLLAVPHLMLGERYFASFKMKWTTLSACTPLAFISCDLFAKAPKTSDSAFYFDDVRTFRLHFWCCPSACPSMTKHIKMW